MHLARFLWRDRVRWGVIEGDEVFKVHGRRSHFPERGAPMCSLNEVRLLAPVERTSKVVGIAANYGKKDDRDGPGLFIKPAGTHIAHLDPIVFPRVAETVIHEAEVGIVIGRTAHKVPVADALDRVLGYTCVNDVSARKLKTSDVGRGTTMRWKHFDTFCPIGPFIATGIDGDDLRIQCRVNGRTDVDSSSAGMIWGVAELVSWTSEVMALHPGDILASGCPDVGEIRPGDTVDVEIEGIGLLRNPVVADA